MTQGAARQIKKIMTRGHKGIKKNTHWEKFFNDFLIFDSFLCRVSCVLCLFLCPVSFSSCTYSEYNLATGQEETLIYDTEKEERVGYAVATQVEKDYKLVDDPALNARLNDILSRIAEVCDRKELVYTIRTIDEKELNAVSLPGGYIYMFKGLTDALKTDDELAAVVAHEVGHITARHSMKRVQASTGMTILQIVTIVGNQPEAAMGVSAMYATLFTAYSRQDEFQADKLSVRYLQRAGYDPNAIVKVLTLLEEESRKKGPGRLAYFRTHPYIQERIGVVKREITGQLDFKSYLNLTGQEKDLY